MQPKPSVWGSTQVRSRKRNERSRRRNHLVDVKKQNHLNEDLLAPQMNTKDYPSCLEVITEAINTFEPDVIVGSSFGAAVAVDLLLKVLPFLCWILCGNSRFSRSFGWVRELGKGQLCYLPRLRGDYLPSRRGQIPFFHRIAGSPSSTL